MTPGLQIRKFMGWADDVIRRYDATNMNVVMFILPADQEMPVMEATVRHPIPKDEELCLAKGPTGKIHVYLRGRQVMFTKKLEQGCLFRLKVKGDQ